MKRRPPTGVYVITGVTAACSLIYELVIAQTLSLLTANLVVWYSLTIGLYVGAMGAGAFLCRRVFRGLPDREALVTVELLLSASGAAAILLIQTAYVWYLFSFIEHGVQGGAVFFSTAVAMIVVVGMLSGCELPLLIGMAKAAVTSGPVTNRVLAVDYLGSLAGGLAFAVWLVPRYDIGLIALFTAAANLAVVWFLLARPAPRRRRSRVAPAAAAALSLVIGAGIVRFPALQQHFLKKYYYAFDEYLGEYLACLNTMPPSRMRECAGRFRTWSRVFDPMDGTPDIERVTSPYQQIDLVRRSRAPADAVLDEAYSSKYRLEPGLPRGYCLFLNGEFQLDVDTAEVYHEYFAHVPVIARGSAPREVLLLGGGDGLLLDELRKHPGIARITYVEIDPAMIRLARSHPVFSAANHRALDDPRVQVVVEDAFRFVRDTERTFDAIYLDFPDPADYDLAKLYSREFYQFVRRRLAPGGMAVAHLPGANRAVAEADGLWPPDAQAFGLWDRYLATLRAGGFRTILPYLSNLELDNADALAGLRRAGVPDAAAAIRRHAAGLRMVFVILTDDVMNPGQPAYRDPGVPLHVLNAKRFRLAFAVPFPAGRADDPRTVNSIMRPSLSIPKVFNIRQSR